MDVNLLKTRVKSDALNSTQTGFGGTVLDSSIHLKRMAVSSEESKKIAANILLMLVFSLVAKWYSDFSTGNEKKLKNKINVQITQINEDIKSKKNLVKEFGKYKVESDEFQRKIIAVKELSRFRLHELKALDYMQGIVPEKLWFNQVDYKDRLFLLKGTALEQQALSNFLEGMESSNFFKEILILKSKEEKSEKGSEVKFELQAQLKVI